MLSTYFYREIMNVKKLRKSAGLTQDEFWSRVGVEQSVGCRYEKGSHPLPESVRTLLTLAYADGALADRMLRILREGFQR